MISVDQFNIKENVISANESIFNIGPLVKGYGNTFGTYLRRVLLSSIPGSAITSVKIDGVDHEYSSLSGVRDDILTILLSLKNIVVKSKTADTVVLEIDVKGKDGESIQVKASDIKNNPAVEIINQEYVITTITGSKSRFKAELTVNRGIEYTFADDIVREEVGKIPLDAIYSPVKLVSYNITAARVGQDTELDQLDLYVKTNGSITPKEALSIASHILLKATTRLNKISESLLNGDEIAVELAKEEKEVVKPTKGDNIKFSNKKSVKVDDLNFSTRLTNALLKAGIDDLAKLEGFTEEELANMKGMGSKSLEELLDALKKFEIKVI